MTILLMLGSASHAQQSPSIDDLRIIERHIENGDWRSLYLFVGSNPRLIAGSSPLAIELRAFVDEVEEGRLERFDAPTGSRSQRTANAQNDRFSIY